MAATRLQDELKKRGPFDSLEQEATLSILRTSDLLENRIARLLRQYDLTLSQYNVLRILRGEGTPLPCLEVAARMVQVAPAITRVLDQLLVLGLIGKKQSEADRRVFLVELTAPGGALLSQIDKPILDLHESLLGHVSKPDLQTLVNILGVARERIAGEDSD